MNHMLQTSPVGPALDDAHEADRLIEVIGVRKKYCRNLRRALRYGVQDILDAVLMRKTDPETLRPDEFWAVDNISFTLQRGESLALLGENGSGKSTLLRLVSGQRKVTAGKIITRGRIVALTELGLGFDPALSGRENIFINGAVFGMTRAQMAELVDDIVAFAEIPDFIDSAVQTYSSGMRARLAFAIATHLEPDILVVDETLAVGDMRFRRKCILHVNGYLERGGSLVLVAHDPFLVQNVCSRAIILHKGRMIFEGSVVEGLKLHFSIEQAQTVSSAGGTIADAVSMDDPALDEMKAAGSQLPELLQAGNSQPVPAVRQPSPAEVESVSQLPAGPPAAKQLSSSQTVVIDDVQMLPESGEALRTNEPATVLIECRSLVEIVIVWAFFVYSADLQSTIACCVSGEAGGFYRLRPGRNRLTARIPRLPLVAGAFALRAGLADPPHFVPIALFGFEDTPSFVTVADPPPSRFANYQRMHKTLTEIPVEWPTGETVDTDVFSTPPPTSQKA